MTKCANIWIDITKDCKYLEPWKPDIKNSLRQFINYEPIEKGVGVLLEVHEKLTCLEYQRAIASMLVKDMLNGGNSLIELGTGHGKSAIISLVANALADHKTENDTTQNYVVCCTSTQYLANYGYHKYA